MNPAIGLFILVFVAVIAAVWLLPPTGTFALKAS